MAGEWQTARIEEVAERVAMGPFGSSIKVETFVSEGVPVISGQHLHGSRVDDKPGFNFITQEHAEKLRNANVQRGDVIFTHAGNIGQVAYIPPTSVYKRYVISQRQFFLRPDFTKVLPEFLVAYFRSPEGRYKLLANTSQVGVPSIAQPVTYLRSLEIPLPPLPEQRAIAHILGTLDDKIENLRKQNETLEAMARALFNAWFVDFEPVRAKIEGRWRRGESLPGLPAHLYDLFPDRLVESELGEIPEGWPIVSFGDIALQGKGSVSPGESPQDSFTHYSLPAFDVGQMPVNVLGEAIKSNKTPVPDGAVLISKLNPHIPRVWLVGKAGENAVCSTEFIVWTPKEPANSAFLYCLASSAEFNSAMRQLVTGTSNSHQRVKPEQLRDIRCIAAGSDAIKEFSAMALCWMNQLLRNRQQSRTLAQLRDTLLPKFISGELRVKDAEAFLQERGL